MGPGSSLRKMTPSSHFATNPAYKKGLRNKWQVAVNRTMCQSWKGQETSRRVRIKDGQRSKSPTSTGYNRKKKKKKKMPSFAVVGEKLFRKPHHGGTSSPISWMHALVRTDDLHLRGCTLCRHICVHVDGENRQYNSKPPVRKTNVAPLLLWKSICCTYTEPYKNIYKHTDMLSEYWCRPPYGPYPNLPHQTSKNITAKKE